MVRTYNLMNDNIDVQNSRSWLLTLICVERWLPSFIPIFIARAQ